MTTICRSELLLTLAAVTLTVTAASRGACQQSSDAISRRAATGSAPRTAREHVVRDGETLWSIAGAVLGDPARWREIVRLNPELGADHRHLVAGMVLGLPESARGRVTVRVTNGEAPIPSPSSGEIDARFRGRTIFFRPPRDTVPPPSVPSTRTDSTPPRADSSSRSDEAMHEPQGTPSRRGGSPARPPVH